MQVERGVALALLFMGTGRAQGRASRITKHTHTHTCKRHSITHSRKIPKTERKSEREAAYAHEWLCACRSSPSAATVAHAEAELTSQREQPTNDPNRERESTAATTTTAALPWLSRSYWNNAVALTAVALSISELSQTCSCLCRTS